MEIAPRIRTVISRLFSFSPKIIIPHSAVTKIVPIFNVGKKTAGV